MEAFERERGKGFKRSQEHIEKEIIYGAIKIQKETKNAPGHWVMQNFSENEETLQEHGWLREFSATRWHHEPKTVWMLWVSRDQDELMISRRKVNIKWLSD